MATTLQRGGNVALSGALSGGRALVALDWTPRSPAGMEVDASAFLLKPDGKVRSDGDMVFYNQPRSPEGAVELLADGRAAGADDAKVFRLDLGGMPAAIDKVAFTVTIHDGAARRQNFGMLSGAVIRVADADRGTEICRFELPLSGSSETAMIFGEVYRRGSEWKFRAVGQGFTGGLGPLATSFGVDVGDSTAPPAPGPAVPPPPMPPAPPASAAPPAAPPSPAAPPAAPPKPGINLSKVTLEKKGQSVSLEKRASGFGDIRVNLNWSRGSAPPAAARGGMLSGLFGGGRRRGSGGIDLDLGCLYELADGRKGAVQALGNAFGAFDQPPYIQLAGDDRTGDVAGGENMRINGAKWSEIRRVLIYAFIYEGVPNWAAADGVVTVYVPGEPPLEVRLDNSRDLGMCAVTMLENDGGSFRVTKLAEYFQRHSEMDQHYHWGMRWVAGSK